MLYKGLISSDDLDQGATGSGCIFCLYDQGLLAMRYSNESQKMEETLKSMGLLAATNGEVKGSMPSV